MPKIRHILETLFSLQHLFRFISNSCIDSIKSIHKKLSRMDLPKADPKQPKQDEAGSKSADDRDFDPSAQALVDEIDDERTLEEEEALAGNEATNVQDELDALKRESEMPIDQLLAYYSRLREQDADHGEQDEDFEEEDDFEDDEEEEEEDDDDYGEGDDDVDSDDRGGRGGRNQSAQKRPAAHAPKNDEGRDQKPESSYQGPRSSCNQPTDSATEVTHDQANDAQSASIIINAESSSTKQDENDQSTCIVPEATESQDKSNPDCSRKRILNVSTIQDGDVSILKTFYGYDLDDGSDDDDDYSYSEYDDDDRSWRKSIRIGPEYQAVIPERLCNYDDEPPYQMPDTPVWRPNAEVDDEQLIEYLKEGSTLSKRKEFSVCPASVPKFNSDLARLYSGRLPLAVSTSDDPCGGGTIPRLNIGFTNKYVAQSTKRVKIDHELEQENDMNAMGAISTIATYNSHKVQGHKDDTASKGLKSESNIPYYQDEEQLLYLLLTCKYLFAEALRRRRLDPYKYYLNEPMALWSQDESLAFEHGLREYGKNIHMIRVNRVQTRSCAEIAHFYYLWKKSERHDVFMNQYKLDRKRSLSHPGTTDYMDKFIEDTESAINAGSSATTPTLPENTNVLISNVDISNENNSTANTAHIFVNTSSAQDFQYVHATNNSMQNHHLHQIQSQTENLDV